MNDAIQILKDLSLEDMESKLIDLEAQKAAAVREIDNQITALKVLIKARRLS